MKKKIIKEKFELNYCKNCMQITNWKNGECCKCEVTDFNKNMSEEERKYCGKEYDEKR